MRAMLRRATGVSLALSTWFFAAPLFAATWVGGRTTPTLREVVAIDATGETSWLYGQEDVAGDGLAVFQPQEQSIDVRTAYAATDNANFWVRTYVSEQNGVGGNVIVYVFIDADGNAATGGRADTVDVNALLTTDPSPGGYEYVLGIRGNGTVENVWSWNAATTRFQALQPNQGTRVGEAGRDVDPIRIGADQHGYVQAYVDLATVGLTAACGANLYFRSVNTAAGIGNGDLDVGTAAPCVARDTNGDRVPDVVVPPSGCTADDQCPNNGVCVNGSCVVAPPCRTASDCPSGQQCTSDGRCVQQGGGPCTTNAQCNGLVCLNGACTACTPGGTECGAGNRCGPDGRCVTGGDPGGTGGDGGLALSPGEEVEGGAFHCATTNPSQAGRSELILLGVAAVAFGSLVSRRRKRSGS